MQAFVLLFALLPVIAAVNPVDLGPVCGQNYRTYLSHQDATAAGVKVLHCGPCGACSNPYDITIMRNTLETLTGTTKACAWRAVFLGRGPADTCMKQTVGFTEKCNACWVDNIMCDKQLCLATCLWSIMRGEGSQKTLDKNACLRCDEEKCGKPFITCAGANRRTTGLVGRDILRTGPEICSIVGK